MNGDYPERHHEGHEYRVIVEAGDGTLATVLTTNVRSSACNFSTRRGGRVQRLAFGEWHDLTIFGRPFGRLA